MGCAIQFGGGTAEVKLKQSSMGYFTSIEKTEYWLTPGWVTIRTPFPSNAIKRIISVNRPIMLCSGTSYESYQTNYSVTVNNQNELVCSVYFGSWVTNGNVITQFSCSGITYEYVDPNDPFL